VVRDAVRLTGRAVTSQGDRALSIDVGGDVVVVENGEGLGEFVVALQSLRGLVGRGIARIHENDSVGREELRLTPRQPTICAVRPGIHQIATGLTVLAVDKDFDLIATITGQAIETLAS
jgi:hypothetical protein